MKSKTVTIRMKATEQYFPVMLFIMLYKVVLPFKSVDEILKCDHSNESYLAVLYCDAVYYTVQVSVARLWRAKGKIPGLLKSFKNISAHIYRIVLRLFTIVRYMLKSISC